MAENDNERMQSELESEGGSGYVLGEGPDAVVISASEARRLRRFNTLMYSVSLSQKSLKHYFLISLSKFLVSTHFGVRSLDNL